ncbi:CAIB/BAIF family protein [alpha proteobacterium U9-1i]|nr:CAIB/BAIF family protein [alpha proteobacterium U9-1i]
MPGPLEGLVVIDMAQVMPSAIAGMLLADHGADVLKVEPPGGAFYAYDLTRKSWDRGKKSVELDLEKAGDRESAQKLVDGADILFHSLSDSDAKRLGFDEVALRKRNSGLAVCALSAYGADTPFADRPYGESLAAALLGTMIDKKSSFREGPMYLGHPALHYGQAFLAVINVLATLRARRETGVGQASEASLLDAMLAQSPMNNWWQEDGISYMKKGDSGASDRFGRTRLVTGLFECGDGLFLQLHTGGPGGFKATMDVVGFGDRIQQVTGAEMAVPLSDEEYQIARVEMYDALKKRPRDEWIDLFQRADVAALPVLQPAEVLLDPQTEFVGQRIEIADPDFGTIHQSAPAIRFARSKTVNPTPAPGVGAHNGELAALAARKPRAIKGAGKSLKHPLAGVRILDFSSFFAVGFGSRLLSDLGADVIKVETPDGDQMRPLPDVFDAAQRGKRDIVLDLKKPEGLELAKKLIASADVMMHNLRPGKADKLGIGYEAMAALNPKLIYAYLPGYGSKGPKSKLKSFAPLVSGWTGLLYEGAGEGNPPTRSVFGNEDYNNGFLGAVAVLMALERRAQTGEGDYLECPQLHSSLFTTAEHFLDKDKKVVYGLRLDKEQMGFFALDRMYKTKDGYVCVCCRDDKGFTALANAIGQPGLVTDARFSSHQARAKTDAELIAIIAPFFATRTSAEARGALDAAGAPAEIVRETSWVEEALWQDWALNTHRVLEHHNSMYGHIREFGLFNRLFDTPGRPGGPAPRLGEHTRAILTEAGVSAADIDDYIARRVAVQFDKAAEKPRQRVSAE